MTKPNKLNKNLHPYFSSPQLVISRRKPVSNRQTVQVGLNTLTREQVGRKFSTNGLEPKIVFVRITTLLLNLYFVRVTSLVVSKLSRIFFSSFCSAMDSRVEITTI